ncbi:class I SAM-dependent methyltransferase [Sedimentitalea sp. XS_ASV28]|uniref:class I SAM-dependent methyltransferase n=1 Tax=Sedimentitalea sp. XS_ASV28 TaxID=3241296 RepID=UPI003511A41B
MPVSNTRGAAGRGVVREPDVVTARILALLADEEVHRVVDIGCGRGGLAAALVRRGYSVTGVDPSDLALDVARARAPGARFLRAGAEAIPASDSSFGAAIFHNALHHLPEGRMEAGIVEAWRLLRSGGVLVVVEPLASGSFFEAMRRVDDETAIRAQALAALTRFADRHDSSLVEDSQLDRISRFSSVDEFLSYLCAADPSRQTVIDADRDAVTRDFLHHAEAVEGGLSLLRQPHMIRVLRKNAG